MSWWKRHHKLVLRGSIYVSIAVVGAVISQTTTSALSPFWAVVFAATLQGLNALKSFTDQTVAWHDIEQREKSGE